MPTTDLWLTTNFDLFRDHYFDDEPLALTHLSLIGLESIRWPESSKQICTHCGSEVFEWPCIGCGGKNGVAGNHLGRALVILYGPLPTATSIFSFPPETVFWAMHAHEGARCIPQNNEGGIRFSNCKIMERSVPGIYSADYKDRERVFLKVTMECNVELFTEWIEV